MIIEKGLSTNKLWLNGEVCAVVILQPRTTTSQVKAGLILLDYAACNPDRVETAPPCNYHQSLAYN
jgi:hypothetical protein